VGRECVQDTIDGIPDNALSSEKRMIAWWVILGVCLLAFCWGFLRATDSEKIDPSVD
jgi:hypothetical protein